MTKDNIRVLLVDHSADFARQVETILQEDIHHKYSVIWKNNGDEALQEIERNSDIDVILIEYFLPGKNGLEVTKALHDLRIYKPIIFVTVNKDFDAAVEVMKLGVDEYLLKEEISGSVLSRTITKVLEKQRLQAEIMALEITRHRLEAMRNLVATILTEVEQPAADMQKSLQGWNTQSDAKKYQKFLNIIKENVSRIMTKIEQLRSLNTDKTVKYIQDIRMIDLS